MFRTPGLGRRDDPETRRCSMTCTASPRRRASTSHLGPRDRGWSAQFRWSRSSTLRVAYWPSEKTAATDPYSDSHSYDSGIFDFVAGDGHVLRRCRSHVIGCRYHCRTLSTRRHGRHRRQARGKRLSPRFPADRPRRYGHRRVSPMPTTMTTTDSPPPSETRLRSRLPRPGDGDGEFLKRARAAGSISTLRAGSVSHET